MSLIDTEKVNSTTTFSLIDFISDQDSFSYGTLSLGIAAFCFGTTHVPIRRFHVVQDGFFIQWAMSSGILVIGFCVNAILDSPAIKPLAVFGGILWAIANSLTQYVITMLGLAVSMLLWNTTNSLTGWSIGRFGLLGLKQNVPPHQLLNLIGLVFGVLGGSSFAFIRRTPNRFALERKNHYVGTKNMSEFFASLSYIDVCEPATSASDEAVPGCFSHSNEPSKSAFSLKQVSCWLRKKFASRRMTAILIALVSGFFYNVTVVPVMYMQQNPTIFPGAPRSALSYILSHYFGVFLGSTAIFVFYALYSGNAPFVDPTTILPSLIGGALWGIGMAALFIANDTLTQTITYPIVTTIPGVVATFWSVFYFREIPMTAQNKLVLFTSLFLIISGSTFVFLSKLNLHSGSNK